MIDTHPFNQAVNAIAIYNKSYLLCLSSWLYFYLDALLI
jgi:hypothetical protein